MVCQPMQPFREKDDALTKAASAIPTRDLVKLDDTWDLTPVFKTAEEWRAAFEKLQAEYPKVAQWKGRVGESAATLREVLEFEKELDIVSENVRVFASLKCAEDAANAESLARQSQVAGMFTLMGEARAFVAPEVQAIDDATFAAFLASPELSEWVVPLTHLLHHALERSGQLADFAFVANRQHNIHVAFRDAFG